MKITTLSKDRYKEIADYAELAWASYGVGFNRGMFGEEKEQWGLNSEGIYYAKNEIDQLKKSKKISLPTYFQVLTEGTSPSVGFTPNQAKRFISRYKVENAFYDKSSNMRAVLFFDTQKDRLILGFRGLDLKTNLIEPLMQAPNLEKVFKAQLSLELFRAIFKLSDHLNKNYKDRKISLIGHSFGGYLAQVFCILQPSLIEEVYTFDAIGISPNSRTTKVFFFFPGDIFSSSAFSYVTHKIEKEDVENIKLDNGLIAFNKKNTKLEKFIPYYLKASKIDQYGMGTNFDKDSMSRFAQKLVSYFHNRDLIGKIMAVDFSITDTRSPNVIRNQEIFILQEDIEVQKLESLRKDMREASHTLPSPLQQSQIHSFYSSTTRFFSIDIQGELAKFGDHVLATQYDPIPINKTFSKEIDYSDLKKIKKILEGDDSKKSLRDIGSSFLIFYCFTLTDIQEICISLLTLAKCEENTPITTLSKLQEPSIFPSRRA